MEAIRTKDKLFLALVAPVALTVAYAYLWRTDAVRMVGALAREDSELVTVADYPLERERARRQLTAARDELAAEEKRPAPEAKVSANPNDTVAARERAVLEVFGGVGIAVERSSGAENGDAAARDALVRTGLRPDPVCRQYAVVGSYPQVCAALRAFAERRMAVIPDRVEMATPGRWTLALWL